MGAEGAMGSGTIAPITIGDKVLSEKVVVK
jgi:hypothetical protein